MKANKNILLTFDFELFLGSNSGSVENCLIKPTEELMKIVKKHEFSTVFFVDTLYMSRLKEVAKNNAAAANDYSKIISILQNVIDYGGYVFHHLHPHWIDAIYLENSNEWDVSNKDKFALNNLSNEEIEEVFKISDEIISEIYVGKNKPSFSGFRAGGLYAQPFSGFKNQMTKYNIKLDFSVLKNAKSSGDNGAYGFDYSIFPSENIYRFSDDLIVKDDKGDFIEIMMDQFNLDGLNKIMNGIYYRMNFKKPSWKRWGDGRASGNVLKSTVKTSKFSGKESFSIELLNKIKAKLYLKEVKKNDLIHIISHPKLFSPNNLEAFEFFIKGVSSKYTVESDVFKILNEYEII